MPVARAVSVQIRSHDLHALAGVATGPQFCFYVLDNTHFRFTWVDRSSILVLCVLGSFLDSNLGDIVGGKTGKGEG